MVYIIVLNWQGAADTLACLNSLVHLRDVNYKIVICDNSSPDNSYAIIRDGLRQHKVYKECTLVEMTRAEAERSVISYEGKHAIFLIQTGANLGYAGGNNVGIRFAMNQSDVDYIWILNNDTEVEPNSLYKLVLMCESDPVIGICGSTMVYFDAPNCIQSIGGTYNKLLMTTKNIGGDLDINKPISKCELGAIDYVIGASMLIPVRVLSKVGLLCEDYFLYYEEIDICNRIKNYKYKISVCTESIVRHKVGASTNSGRSDVADFCSVRNRLLIAKKFHPYSFVLVWISLVFVFINRLRRKELAKAKNVFMILFGKRKMNKV